MAVAVAEGAAAAAVAVEAAETETVTTEKVGRAATETTMPLRLLVFIPEVIMGWPLCPFSTKTITNFTSGCIVLALTYCHGN